VRIISTPTTSLLVRLAAVAVVVATLLMSSKPERADALWHFASINEIMVGAGGNPAIQYIEIRTNQTNQNVISGGGITVFQGAGFTVIPTIGPDLPNPLTVNRWIMASPSAAEFLAASGISTNLTFTGQLPTTNAMVCWGKPGTVSNPNDAGYADCVAYGGYGGSTPVPGGTVSLLNAGDGQQSLTRIGDSGGDFADFALACPTPENWSAAIGSFGPCVGVTDTDGDQLDDAWEGTYSACVTVGPNDRDADVDTPTPDGLTNFQEMNGGSNPCMTNTDGDGCSDGEERGIAPALGGRRNPKSDGLGLYDFYDVNANLVINAADIGLVRSKFNQPFPAYDRSNGVAPWAPGPPSGGNISALEVGLARASFNHSCAAAP
jgi:hypothetical protein